MTPHSFRHPELVEGSVPTVARDLRARRSETDRIHFWGSLSNRLVAAAVPAAELTDLRHPCGHCQSQRARRWDSDGYHGGTS